MIVTVQAGLREATEQCLNLLGITSPVHTEDQSPDFAPEIYTDADLHKILCTEPGSGGLP